MVRKKPAPDLIRGGYRFSEKTMLKRKNRTSRAVDLAHYAGQTKV
jgi:hypothetical protein